MQQITEHPDAFRMREKIKHTRACVAGEFFVKELEEELLPHPSVYDCKSADARIRYQIYLGGAEWDAYPGNTLDSLVGRMKFDAASVEMPDRLSYLMESADGDGLSLKGMMQNSAREVLPLNWECIVVDYQGLSDADLTDVSLEDVKRLNPRATIKSYSRENVVNWHYERINGTMQLTFIMLREEGSTFSSHSGLRTLVESYLILALDDEGNYYQQKIVKALNSSFEIGEQVPVSVNGQPLKWLPVLFASDKELQAGKLPVALGYLSPICDLALYRYRMSAEYKESLRNLPPTTYTSGWTDQAWETFAICNNNRQFLMTGSGAVNNLPEGVTVDIIGVDGSVEPYERFLAANTAKARELGAVIPDDTENQTATQVNKNSGEQNARLMQLAQSLESVYRRAILYCGMFEGLWAADAVEQNLDQVMIELHKDFEASKLSVEEVRVIIELVMSGLKTREQGIRELAEGGWSLEDAELTLNNIDAGSDVNLTPEV